MIGLTESTTYYVRAYASNSERTAYGSEVSFLTQDSEYTLTVAVSGFGSVASSPTGIDCQSDCSEVFDYNTLVSLTALPNTGFMFQKWTGSTSTSSSTNSILSLTMTSDKSLTAHFIADTDCDSMPDNWENQYGLDPSTDDADEDADGDGFTNLEEYQAGTDPTNPDSYPGVGMPVTLLLLLGE